MCCYTFIKISTLLPDTWTNDISAWEQLHYVYIYILFSGTARTLSKITLNKVRLSLKTPSLLKVTIILYMILCSVTEMY